MDLAARSYGAQSMTAPLRRVLVVAPRPEEVGTLAGGRLEGCA